MKSKEFLTESKDDQIYQLMQQIIEENTGSNNITMNDLDFFYKVANDCKPFLNDTGYGMYELMRGLSKWVGHINVVNPKNSPRSPVAMNHQTYTKINNFFLTKFGHPYRNGVFATGDLDHAEMFGNAYNIFPVGNYKFVWSPQVKDANFLQGDKLSQLQDAEWLTTDLPDAIQSGNEIMIWTKKYYVIVLMDMLPFYKMMELINAKR